MSKLIAIRSGFDAGLFHVWKSDFFSLLKQQCLLFDQIGILNLNQTYDLISNLKSFPDLSSGISDVIRTELEYLEQTGLIFNLTIQDELSQQNISSFYKSSTIENEEEVDKLIREIKKRQTIKTTTIEELANTIDSVNERDTFILRLLSLIMETTKRTSVVTTLPYIEYTRNIQKTSSKGNIAQIVINQFPLPNNQTPWEQIIDYRNDPENQRSLLDLRRWIRKISTESLSSHEIEEEIKWLINEFENHMKLHKMKANTETVEVITKAPLEFLELKFSKIIDPLFAIKKRKINLLEAEMNAPGREISYIIKTQEAF